MEEPPPKLETGVRVYGNASNNTQASNGSPLKLQNNSEKQEKAISQNCAKDLDSSDDEEDRVVYKPAKVEKIIKETGIVPERFKKAHLFEGYNRKVDALYRTTSSDYGSWPPSELTMPENYYGFTRKFTSHLGGCGMYRNHSLNCRMDK